MAEPAVVILSGLSGGGKTAAAKLFEDLGYTVVDNLPGELLPDLAELVSSDRERFARVAIVLDVRAGDATLALAAMRGALEGRGIRPRVVFLEASDDVLIRRFSETRHRHPLDDERGIASSIAEERRIARSGPGGVGRRRRHLRPVAAPAPRAAVRRSWRPTSGPTSSRSSSSASATSTACRSRPTWCSTSGSCRTRTTSPSSARCPG